MPAMMKSTTATKAGISKRSSISLRRCSSTDCPGSRNGLSFNGERTFSPGAPTTPTSIAQTPFGRPRSAQPDIQVNIRRPIPDRRLLDLHVGLRPHQLAKLLEPEVPRIE